MWVEFHITFSQRFVQVGVAFSGHLLPKFTTVGPHLICGDSAPHRELEGEALWVRNGDLNKDQTEIILVT